MHTSYRVLLLTISTMLLLFTGCHNNEQEYRLAIRQLNGQIAQITPQLPMQLNEYTQLTSMTYDEERRQICYGYTIDDAMARVLTIEGREEIHNGILHSLHAQLPESRAFTQSMKRYDIIYHYAYESASGEKLFTFTITPDEVLTGISTGAVTLPESVAL